MSIVQFCQWLEDNKRPLPNQHQHLRPIKEMEAVIQPEAQQAIWEGRFGSRERGAKRIVST